jgi:ferric-dicitrate binding protein FerR (iron transport regulator)
MANRKVSVAQLAADEHFQQWVLAPNPELDKYWKQWTEEHPQYQPAVDEARQLLLNLHLAGDQVPSKLQQEVWTKIKPVLGPKDEPAIQHWILRTKVGVAAALIAIVAASILFLTHFLSGTTNHQTAYGETKEIMLPDGSTAMLNANSSIRFASDWESAEVREVWLEGEAFFDVRQIPLSKDGNVRLPFVVHSQNMDVEVLGTTFNVKDRQKYSEVVLNTGKVNVTPRLEKESAPIAMNPGDRLAYSASEQEWKIQQVNPEIPTAWRYQELIFDEMPLGEIAQLLEDVYGYEISFEAEEIKSHAFTGNIKTDEVEMLLPMLERSFSLKIYQDGEAIKFARK